MRTISQTRRSVVPGRERTFFVNKELTNIDDMLAGVMIYKAHGSSPYHYHEICEHFYFIMEGQGTVESEEGVRPVGPGDLVYIPADAKHRLRATRDRPVLFRIPSARIVSRPTSWMARRTICAGTAWTAAFGSKRRKICP